MAKLGTDEKRIFLIASANQETLDHLSAAISKHIHNSMIYTATDGFEAMFKMENDPPHVLIADGQLPKLTNAELTSKILNHPKLSETSIILASAIPEQETFVDQVVTCQVQYLTNLQNDVMISTCLAKALNRLADDKKFAYRLRFLSPKEILFREGDEAHSVYIVKRGEMHAIKGDGLNAKILGKITIGEFVGEMAHINGEPRSATVIATADCELIEIPRGTLDTVLFSKPAWTKALVATLSKRLKKTNENL